MARYVRTGKEIVISDAINTVRIDFNTSSTGRNYLYCRLTKQDGANTVTATEVELEYERRWKSMSPAEKVSRSAAISKLIWIDKGRLLDEVISEANEIR